MSLKKCEQCGEAVDAAKAFCPECGNPFVEEQEREESSEYESYAGTINVSKSMYKMMLSEMELDTSASQDREEKSETPKPTEKQKPPQKKPDLQQKATPDIYQQPAPPLSKPTDSTPSDREDKSGVLKWVAIAGVGLFILGILVLAVLVAGYFYFV